MFASLLTDDAVRTHGSQAHKPGDIYNGRIWDAGPASPFSTVIYAKFLEHLREFAKINLANIVIWQLPKVYAK